MMDVFDSVLNKANEAHPINPGDYEKDGLMYCGICHETKQYRVSPIPGVPSRIVPIACRCEREQKEMEEHEHDEALRQWNIKDNIKRCFWRHPEQKKCSFANDDGKNPELMNLAQGYCHKFNEIRQHDKQRGLLFFGSPGGGKSYAACAICNELLEQGYSCRIATIPELTNELQSRYDKNEYLDEFCDIDLLVLDDFGVQRNTSTANEQLFEIINRLLLDRVPVIVTTNMTGEELKNPGDTNLQRITSRLFELCFPFEVKGNDRRKSGLKDNYQSLKKLLET